jgi:hypothetical protein
MLLWGVPEVWWLQFHQVQEQINKKWGLGDKRQKQNFKQQK